MNTNYTSNNHILYVDNFRGFKNTYVPICDVNYFVGENSSGKTSLISLLKLMSSKHLLLENQFSSDAINLGTFRSILNVEAEDSNSFRIGMIRTTETEQSIAMLVTYENQDGLPIDTKFTCILESQEITILRTKDGVKYRINSLIVPKNIKPLFQKWIIEQKSKSINKTFKNFEHILESNTPLCIYLSLISLEEKKKDGEDRFYGISSRIDFRVFPALTWLAPIRTKPKRTYDELQSRFSSEGVHTPYLIRKTLESKAAATKFRKTIQKFGKESGLFDSVEIKKFGSDVTAPFEINITLNGNPFNITHVGYGVSQVLPVIVEILRRVKGSWFAIQQPEVHLHPRAQAAFGDLVFEMARTENKKFLIETHSDFIIDRFKMSLKKSRNNKFESQILFFERKNGKNFVTPLKINDQGELSANQPKAYRSFFLKETMRALNL